MNIPIVMVLMTFVAFIIAAIYAFLIHRKTKKITNLWLLITTALFSFALVALVRSIGLILDLDVIKDIGSLFLVVGATILCCVFCQYKKERDLAKDAIYGRPKKISDKRYMEIENWLKGV